MKRTPLEIMVIVVIVFVLFVMLALRVDACGWRGVVLDCAVVAR